MGQKDSHDPRQMNRRGFLEVGVAAGAAALASWALSGIAEKARRKILPKATLIIIGGSAEAGGRIPSVAGDWGITAEDLKNPAELRNILSPWKFNDFARACDYAGVFADVKKYCPFKDKTVVCVTSASKENAVEHAWLDQIFFRLMGAKDVVTIADRKEANDKAIVKKLKEEACMVYFDGGAQEILQENFFNTDAYHAVHQRYLTDSSFTVIGTSAGAAVMPGKGKMIKDWDKTKTEAIMGTGFNFLENIIVDTHVHGGEKHLHENPNRLGRLQKAVDEHPGCIGIGLDERTGIVIQNGNATVIGRQYVWKLDESTRGLTAKQLQEVPGLGEGKVIKLGEHAYITADNRPRSMAL